MAIPHAITTIISDASGTQGSTTHFVQNGASLSQLGEIAVQLANVIDDITEGKIEAMKARISADMSALTGNTALDGSDVGDLGQFQFRTLSNRPVRVNVPALAEGVVGAGSDDINQANVDVAALISAFEDGLAGILPCNIAQEDIVSTEFARERFKNRGARN